MDSITDLLTVIITTSPTPSSPSPELISSVIQSFRQHCPDLTTTRVIVVFDSYDRVTYDHPRLKSGSVSPEIAGNYAAYKGNVKALVLHEYLQQQQQQNDEYANHDEGQDLRQTKATAEFGSYTDENNEVELEISQTGNKIVTFIEPAARLGFGLAVRSALRVIETPYVWVQQHDWALVADIPVRAMLEVMQTHNTNNRFSSTFSEERSRESVVNEAPIKYISLPSVRMWKYAESAPVIRYPTLRALTATLKADFIPPSQPDIKVPLTPLFFWFDKPHLVSTEHYLARVFPSRLAMRRGEFIEDKIGQRARGQMKEGNWAKWATWLYYPGEEKGLCLRHLMGRTWRGCDGELLDKYQLWAQE